MVCAWNCPDVAAPSPGSLEPMYYLAYLLSTDQDARGAAHLRSSAMSGTVVVPNNDPAAIESGN
ncbi:MAG TPA: hypothetical protein VNL71_04330, partial [Chloroflexota bacterium]|nr:hypothetical protein [Chloroflexota bacterium]